VLQGQGLLETRPVRRDPLTRGWVIAGLLFGLLLIAGVREGGFWPTDAFVVAAGSIVLLAAAVVTNPLDRRAFAVVAALVSLALWWGVRASTAESLSAVLPFGAGCLACASAYAAVRALRGRSRQLAALGIACLGAAGGLIGFAGLVWRWFPLAMPAQGLWRLSTTLTYSDAAGLALGMCLLVALGVERHPGLVRVAVCLCSAGLLATQSRGAFLAFACAATLVPWRRYPIFSVPLLAGVALGVAAIATSPDQGGVPWLGVVLIAAIGISAVPPSSVGAVARNPRVRMLAVLLGLVGVLASAILLHHEIGLRALAPSDQDRSAEWAIAWHQWGSAPIFGVGPDRLLLFHTVDGTYAKFVHNEYLQVAADAGAVGLALLLAALLAIVGAVRRFDVLSSCACAALVCCAVGGAFDFDWHLPFVGLLAGWCAGLAARMDPVDVARLRSEGGI
jgi:hypothetical protein